MTTGQQQQGKKEQPPFYSHKAGDELDPRYFRIGQGRRGSGVFHAAMTLDGGDTLKGVLIEAEGYAVSLRHYNYALHALLEKRKAFLNAGWMFRWLDAFYPGWRKHTIQIDVTGA